MAVVDPLIFACSMDFTAIFAIGATILVFAMIGLIATVVWLINLGTKRRRSLHAVPPPQFQPQPQSREQDLLSARRLLESLRFENRIGQERFEELCDFLDEHFPSEMSDSPYRSHRRTKSPKELAERKQVLPTRPEESVRPTPPTIPDPLQAADVLDAELIDAELTDEATIQPGVDSWREDLKDPLKAPLTPPVGVPEKERIAAAAGKSVLPKSDLPKSVPDASESLAGLDPRLSSLLSSHSDKPLQPVHQAEHPRRSFNEIIAAFMLERNMRWGELASGILIVLSAIGLVGSLRNELNDRIPYFSSLLFLLITAAIIGAGIYTLRRWKLRNTSRGTLIIGLLLIPINFVAATQMLSNEQGHFSGSFKDPRYLMAVAVGLISLSILAWFGAKYLLKHSFAGLASSLVGCGACSVIFRHLAESPNWFDSSIKTTLYSIPLGLFLALGTSAVSTRTWTAKRCSPRTTRRLLCVSGIVIFAVLCAASVWLIPSSPKWQTSVAMVPILILATCYTAWVGYSIRQQSPGHGYYLFFGQFLQIIGTALTFIFMVASLSNPTILLINCLLIAVCLGFLILRARAYGFIPPFWGALSASALTGYHLTAQNLPFDQHVPVQKFLNEMISGKSGVCLLVCGVIAAAVQSFHASRISDARVARTVFRWGNLSGGVIFLVGCAVSLIASLLHPENLFDAMVASGLLLVAGVGATIASVLNNRRRELLHADTVPEAYVELWPATKLALVAVVVLLLGLAHALLWNLWISDGFAQWTKCVQANGIWVLAIHGLILAIASRIERPGADEDVFLFGSMITSTLALLVATAVIPLHSGNATSIAAVSTLSWFLISWSWVRNGKYCEESTIDSAVPFVVATGVLVGIATAEWVDRPGWGERIGVSHVFYEIIALSVWAAIWTVLAIALPKAGRLKWLVSAMPRVEQVVVPYVVVFGTGILAAGLFDASLLELFRSRPALPGLLSVSNLATVALVAMWSTVLFMTFQKTGWIKGVCLTLLWIITWCFGAAWFEPTRSSASALRWFAAAGGVVLAGAMMFRTDLYPAWTKARIRAGMPGRSRWPSRITQGLIHFNVAAVALTVLAITTLHAGQAILNGASALGGPLPGSWFASNSIVTFGVPIFMTVAMFLSYAISERKPGLAMLGSMVFQYTALLAVVLLVAAPFPQAATEFFVAVMQTAAMGMSVYGLIWFAFERRIHSGETLPNSRQNALSLFWKPLGNVRIHTFINGALITALAFLVISHYFWQPQQSVGWLRPVGSIFGMSSLAVFAVLAVSVWGHNQGRDTATTHLWLFTWLGLMLIGLVAAASDFYSETFEPWLAFRLINWGTVILGMIQVGLLWNMNQRSRIEMLTPGFDGHRDLSTLRQLQSEQAKVPFLVTMAVALAFALRGAWLNPDRATESVWILGLMASLIFLGGMLLRRGWMFFVAGATAMIMTGVVEQAGWLDSFYNQPRWLNLTTIVLAVLAMLNIAGKRFIEWRYGERLTRSFVWFANVVLLAISTWIIVGGELQLFTSSAKSPDSDFSYGLVVAVFAAAIGLLVASLWNEWRAGWPVSFALISIGLGATVATLGERLLFDSERGSSYSETLQILAHATVALVWGLVWFFGSRWTDKLSRLSIPRKDSLVHSFRFEIPVCAMVLTAILIPIAGMITLESRPESGGRWAVAITPMILALAFGLLNRARQSRFLQPISLSLAVMGVLYFSWVWLELHNARENLLLLVFASSFMVLATAAVLYSVVPRWLRSSERWTKTLLEMGLACAVVATLFLFLLNVQEWVAFVPKVGSGLSAIAAWAVVLAGVPLVASLILFAVQILDTQDRFEETLNHRKGLVYWAQWLVASLLLHLFLSVPWLFQLEIREYWPYVAMAICFAGVGISHVLKSRNLEVLSDPLFSTASIIPIGVAIAYFTVHSSADGGTLMLIAGLAYLVMSYLNQSMASGLVAIMFGNMALWMFYQRFDSFSFARNPQWWLIPPATSALIAAHLNRNRLKPPQLAAIRYFCAAVIYVSSTSEIFLSGLGENIWPPIILAVLAIVGLMAGIVLRIRSFLYLSILFLLVAMLSMVSHAHQRLDHVWPWWAFGIASGIGILILFGMFEKRKNEMRGLANRLKDWDV